MVSVKEEKFFLKIFTSLIFKDRFFQVVFGIAIIINIINLIVIFWKFPPPNNPEKLLPLHYNIYFGIDFVGEWRTIFIIPAVGFFFTVINFILADIIYVRDKVIGYFLAGESIVVQVLMLLATYAVISINQ